MRLIDKKQLKQILRRTLVSLRRRVIILMYHRVIETSSDPWNLNVSPKHFSEHLEHLRPHYPVLSLNQLLSALKCSQLPRRGVIITFDDGYADNLWNAKPLLEEYEVPATVFVASGSIDNSGFWWDDLERALLKPKKLPKCLQLIVQDRSYEWPTTNSDQRQHAYIDIHQILKPLRVSDRYQVITELFALADVDKMGPPDYRPLTTTELIQLSQSDFIDIGAHTMTHASLSIMSQADQFAEIDGCRQKLKAILGSQVNTFSYPYGNFTSETVDIVKSAGFEMALTSEINVVETGANRFQLGRFEVGDWGGEEFKHHLNEFFRT